MPRMRHCPTTTIASVLIATLLALAACQRGPDTNEPNATSGRTMTPFERKEHQWRTERRDSLLGPDGWTSLVGLHWIEPGGHYLGSAADSGIRLEMGPAHLGLLRLDAGTLHFTPDASAQLTLDGQPLDGPVDLRTDMADGGPSVIGFDQGDGRATVIERGGRYALRVKHAQAPSRTGFTGLAYWPADPAWQVEATFAPHPAGQTIEIASVIGTTNAVPNPGRVEFERDGRQFSIEAQDEGDGRLFLVFADRTNGQGSYGAGRFLYAPMPGEDGKLVVDFNQAYNPPCAFTDFATCPLPPPENRLDLAVTAGEKAYVKPGSK